VKLHVVQSNVWPSKDLQPAQSWLAVDSSGATPARRQVIGSNVGLTLTHRLSRRHLDEAVPQSVRYPFRASTVAEARCYARRRNAIRAGMPAPGPSAVNSDALLTRSKPSHPWPTRCWARAIYLHACADLHYEGRLTLTMWEIYRASSQRVGHGGEATASGKASLVSPRWPRAAGIPRRGSRMQSPERALTI